MTIALPLLAVLAGEVPPRVFRLDPETLHETRRRVRELAAAGIAPDERLQLIHPARR